jgi:hypothetical protein
MMLRPKSIQIVAPPLARTDSLVQGNERVERPLAGFGMTPPIAPAEMYLKQPKNKGRKRGMKGGGTGSVTTKNELGLRLTDFFEYTTFDATAGGVPQVVNNYYWEVNQNLFDTAGSPPGGQEQTFCRVRQVCVWVMPLCRAFGPISGDVQPQDNSNAMLTVNVQTPGVGTQFGSTTQAFATNTQVTNVLPTINPKWKKVFTCDLQKTFQSGTIRPVFASTQPSQQCLFQMSIVNPDDGTPYLVGDDLVPIKVKVQLLLDQPIATVQAAKLLVFKNEEFSLPFTEQNGAAYSGTTESYVQLDLQKVSDNMR